MVVIKVSPIKAPYEVGTCLSCNYTLVYFNGGKRVQYNNVDGPNMHFGDSTDSNQAHCKKKHLWLPQLAAIRSMQFKTSTCVAIGHSTLFGDSYNVSG